MTKHIATIKITLKEKAATDGILERISDLAFEYDTENDGSDLLYTMRDDDKEKLRTQVGSFIQALREFFTTVNIPAYEALIQTTYPEETAQ